MCNEFSQIKCQTLSGAALASRMSRGKVRPYPTLIEENLCIHICMYILCTAATDATSPFCIENPNVKIYKFLHKQLLILKIVFFKNNLN